MREVVRTRATLLGIVVGGALSLLFLWLAVRRADPDEVWAALRTADAGWVALAVGAIALVYLLQAIRWRRVARTPVPRTRRFVEMVVSGVAVNNVLPGRVGDFLRARWLQVDARIAGGRALATVFVDRSFDLLALVIFLVVSLPFIASAEWLAKIAVGGLVLLVLVVLALVAARIYTRRRPRQRRARGLVRRVVRDTLEGLADPLGRRRGALLVAISLTAWSSWALGAWLVARSLAIELTPIEAIFVTAVINLGVAIPSSPGFIGTYQWLAVSALALVGVGADQALAFGILCHAVWYVPTLIVGGALLIRRAVRSVRPSTGATIQHEGLSDA